MIHHTPSSNDDSVLDSIPYTDWQPYACEQARTTKFVALMYRLLVKKNNNNLSFDHRVAGFYRRVGDSIEIRTRITARPNTKTIAEPDKIWPPGFNVNPDTADITIHYDPTVSDSVHVTGVALVNNKI